MVDMETEKHGGSIRLAVADELEWSQPGFHGYDGPAKMPVVATGQ